ncbi:hypothetical protein JCM14635_22980 [Megalodesulfovibrio paquesii]
MLSTVFPSPALGLPENLRFERLGLEQGLSQSSVLCSIKDSQGFLWFGTYDGLNRYDGLDFRIYRSRDASGRGLSDDGIRSLAMAQDGTIWVATSAGGINRYNNALDRFTSYLHDPDNPDSLSSNEALVVLPVADTALQKAASPRADQAILWVGTSAGLDYMLPDGRFVHVHPTHANGTQIRLEAIGGLARDKQGNIWAGGEDSVMQLNPQGELLAVYGAEASGDVPLTIGPVQCLLVDVEGFVWIGDSGSLQRLDPISGTVRSYFIGDSVKALLQDSQGILWVCTDSGLARRMPGMHRGEPDRFIRYSHNPFDLQSLSSNDLNSILEDNAGILWIGTYTEGLNKMNPRNQEFHLLRSEPWRRDGLPDGNINAVIQDKDGVLWLGTTYGGLNRVNLATREVRTYCDGDGTSFPAREVRSLTLDTEGQLWLGTSDAGVLRMDRHTGEFVQYSYARNNPASLSSNNVYVIYDDRKGSLWVGLSKAGLDRLDMATGRVEHFEPDPGNPDALQHKRVRAILEHGGRLWFGTSGGLHLLDRETGRFRHWRHNPVDPYSLLDDKVISLLGGPGPDTLWVGTNSGLCLFNYQTNTFVPFTPAHGYNFANNFIAATLKDETGDLWISTFKGLSRFSPASGKVHNFTPLEGLQGYEFMENSAFRNATGDMFFGGLKGLTWFHPGRVSPNPHTPPVVLTGVTVMNRPLESDVNITLLKELSLSHRDALFSFSFAALDFAVPAKNAVAYKLEGFDMDWIQAQPGWSASYTSIEPGNYLFRVKAANSDGQWSPRELQLPVHIEPPFWQTIWFRLLMALSIISGLYLFYWLRVRIIKQQNQRLELLAAERTKSLALINAQLQGIMLHAPCAIALKDENRRYTLVNPRFEHLFLTSQEHLRHKTDAEVFDVETATLLQAADQSAWEHGKSDVFEMTVAGRMLLVQQVAFRGENDKPYALCGIALDVTDKKQFEAETLRASQLASIGELAAGVAHEINNPITGIINYTQLLHDGYTGGIPDITGKILALADRVAVIARGLLSYSRGDLERESPLDLREVVTDSLSLSRYRFEKEGFRVVVEVPDELPLVMGRFRELQQVLLNLLSNAFHALQMKKQRLGDSAEVNNNPAKDIWGECLIRVSLPEDRPGYARMEVRDTGIGITPANLGKVCQPFFTTKPRNEGTGLGLSISLNIINRHRGEMTITSKENNYTSVRVDLPLAD